MYSRAVRPHVRVRFGDERDVELGHGDLVGRLPGAALSVDDCRVSEAHAMVSLRGQSLVLLSLRRRVLVGGKPVSEVELRPHLRVELVEGLGFVVEEVVLPSAVLGVSIDGNTPEPLRGVCSVADDPPRVLAGVVAGARAHIWNADGRWRVQTQGGALLPVASGTHLDLEGIAVSFVELPIVQAGVEATRAGTQHSEPLEVIARFDTVHIGPVGAPPAVSLSGVAARMVSAMLSVGQPISWHVLAVEIWSGDDDRMSLRRRWDVNLSRLRGKLRDARVRSDLIRADGLGNFELLRYPGDVWRDES